MRGRFLIILSLALMLALLYESYTKKWIGDQCKMVIAEKL